MVIVIVGFRTVSAESRWHAPSGECPKGRARFDWSSLGHSRGDLGGTGEAGERSGKFATFPLGIRNSSVVFPQIAYRLLKTVSQDKTHFPREAVRLLLRSNLRHRVYYSKPGK